jgi:excisionase family DNA binding protein
MQTVVISPEELREIINGAVEKAVTDHIPGAIRKATRKEYLTIEELSDLTGWSRRTIQYLRDSRQLTFYQDGRRILFKTDEVEEYLNSKKVNARTV